MDEGKAIPILPMRETDATLAFYARLGFAVVLRQDIPDPYAIVTRGPLELHFAGRPDHDPRTTAGACYLRVGDPDALRAAFAAGLEGAEGYRLTPVEDKPWRMREFALVDPDGNLLRVGRAL